MEFESLSNSIYLNDQDNSKSLMSESNSSSFSGPSALRLSDLKDISEEELAS